MNSATHQSEETLWKIGRHEKKETQDECGSFVEFLFAGLLRPCEASNAAASVDVNPVDLMGFLLSTLIS